MTVKRKQVRDKGVQAGEEKGREQARHGKTESKANVDGNTSQGDKKWGAFVKGESDNTGMGVC